MLPKLVLRPCEKWCELNTKPPTRFWRGARPPLSLVASLPSESNPSWSAACGEAREVPKPRLLEDRGLPWTSPRLGSRQRGPDRRSEDRVLSNGTFVSAHTVAPAALPGLGEGAEGHSGVSLVCVRLRCSQLTSESDIHSPAYEEHILTVRAEI